MRNPGHLDRLPNHSDDDGDKVQRSLTTSESRQHVEDDTDLTPIDRQSSPPGRSNGKTGGLSIRDFREGKVLSTNALNHDSVTVTPGEPENGCQDIAGNVESEESRQTRKVPTHGMRKVDRRKHNRLRHGIFATLPLSELPRPFTYTKRVVNEFRRVLEAVILARDGELSHVAACKIQTACRAERAAQIAERLLRDGWADLTSEQKLAVLDRTVRYSESRDKALAALGLDKRETQDIWEGVFDATRKDTRPEPTE